jgi:integrase/recombinase XerD
MVIGLAHAVEGFNLHLQAEKRSPHTISDYEVTLRRFTAFCGALTRIDLITPDRIRQFLADWAEREVAPAGIAPRPVQKLSAKSIKNMHAALSSFFAWAEREQYIEQNPITDRIKPPTSTPPPIDPLTVDEARRLTAAARGSRDQAIISFLLDTGCRASELCGITRANLDVAGHSALVNGKGGKRRIIPFGDKTARLLFRYLASRNGEPPTALVFKVRSGEPLRREALLDLVHTVAKRANVSDCYPHRLRHTFAISYLRNGGDIYTLQAILGHSDLDMVKRYLAIAGADVQSAHRRASPVDNL